MPMASVTSNDNIQYNGLGPQDQSVVVQEVEDQVLQDYRSHGSSDEEEKAMEEWDKKYARTHNEDGSPKKQDRNTWLNQTYYTYIII